MPNENQDSLKVYEMFRDRIKHQDTLISYRVTFFLVMQTGIVTALKNWPSQKVGQIESDDWITYWVLPAMGWVLALGLLLSIYFAYYGIETCMQQYYNLEKCRSTKLANIKMIALPPKLYGAGRIELGAMPPLRASWVSHLFGHSVTWFITFLSLCFWPFVFSHTTFAELASGHVNAWFFALLIGGIFAYLALLVKHVRRCVKNDSLGI